MKINLITDLKKGSLCYNQLKKIVNLCAPTSNKNLVNFYKRMGVVISPSHFETYGNVPKESIASGTPAIVNCKMGVAETFKKLGIGRWIIDFGSEEKACKKIISVIGQKVDKAVRSKIKKLYSPAKIFNQMIGILRSVEEKRF